MTEEKDQREFCITICCHRRQGTCIFWISHSFFGKRFRIKLSSFTNRYKIFCWSKGNKTHHYYFEIYVLQTHGLRMSWKQEKKLNPLQHKNKKNHPSPKFRKSRGTLWRALWFSFLFTREICLELHRTSDDYSLPFLITFWKAEFSLRKTNRQHVFQTWPNSDEATRALTVHIYPTRLISFWAVIQMCRCQYIKPDSLTIIAL